MLTRTTTTTTKLFSCLCQYLTTSDDGDGDDGRIAQLVDRPDDLFLPIIADRAATPPAQQQSSPVLPWIISRDRTANLPNKNTLFVLTAAAAAAASPADTRCRCRRRRRRPKVPFPLFGVSSKIESAAKPPNPIESVSRRSTERIGGGRREGGGWVAPVIIQAS